MQYVDLPVGQAGGPCLPRQPITLSRRAEHCLDYVTGELALFYINAQRAGGRVGRHFGAPRPVGRQRLERVSSCEDPRRLRNPIAGQASVIAGSVEPFMMAGGGSVDGLQALTSTQHPLREIGAEPHRFPLTRIERSWSVQGAVRNTGLA